jgi:hypothetical protein
MPPAYHLLLIHMRILSTQAVTPLDAASFWRKPMVRIPVMADSRSGHDGQHRSEAT